MLAVESLSQAPEALQKHAEQKTTVTTLSISSVLVIDPIVGNFNVEYFSCVKRYEASVNSSMTVIIIARSNISSVLSAR